MINLKQPMWMIAIGHLLGVAAISFGIALVLFDIVSWYWLLLWPITHITSSLMVTVGLHRYFCHAAFKTSKFWHIVMAYYSILLLQGSPLGWASAHTTHHVHADTDGDPHDIKLSYLVWKKYNDVPMVHGRLKKLINDPTLKFVHRYGMVLWVVFVTVLLSISWELFIFGYAMALGSVHLIGGIHQVTSHFNNRPNNYPLMEYILPASGEWMHKTHHENPKLKDLRTEKWHLDLGYLFIRMIEK